MGAASAGVFPLFPLTRGTNGKWERPQRRPARKNPTVPTVPTRRDIGGGTTRTAGEAPGGSDQANPDGAGVLVRTPLGLGGVARRRDAPGVRTTAGHGVVPGVGGVPTREWEQPKKWERVLSRPGRNKSHCSHCSHRVGYRGWHCVQNLRPGWLGGCARIGPPISLRVGTVGTVGTRGVFFASWTGVATVPTFWFSPKASGNSGNSTSRVHREASGWYACGVPGCPARGSSTAVAF